MLVDALVRCRAPKLRRIVAWSARRTYTIAGIDQIEWIRAELDVLDNADPLPYPFDDRASTCVGGLSGRAPYRIWTTNDNGEKAAVATNSIAAKTLLAMRNDAPPRSSSRSVRRHLKACVGPRCCAFTDGSGGQRQGINWKVTLVDADRFPQ